MTVRQLVADTGPALVSSASMLVVGFPLNDYLVSSDVPVLLTVAIVGLVCGPIYLLTLRATSRPAFNDVFLIIQRVLIPARFHKPAPAAPTPAST